MAAYQAANENVLSILGRGQRIQEERTAFRQHAAAVVQGYRTKDVTFRVFRNEALEQGDAIFPPGTIRIAGEFPPGAGPLPLPEGAGSSLRAL